MFRSRASSLGIFTTTTTTTTTTTSNNNNNNNIDKQITLFTVFLNY